MDKFNLQYLPPYAYIQFMYRVPVRFNDSFGHRLIIRQYNGPNIFTFMQTVITCNKRTAEVYGF